MTDSLFLKPVAAVPDIYTDLHGLQKLSNNTNTDEALRKVAEQFESMFLSLLLKNMRSANAVFEQDSPFSSNEANVMRDMYDQQLSLNMAHGQGTGLADVLYRQLKSQYLTSAEDSEKSPALDQLRRLQDTPPLSEVPNPQREATAVDSAQRQALVDTPSGFVEKLAPFARAAARRLGVDPLLLVAQAALETGWGQKVLADAQGESSNNVFNIKANAQWQGGVVPVQALEYRDGVAVREFSEFKKYPTLDHSFGDFADLISSSPRYASARDTGANPRAFMDALQAGGYATDPAYSDKVMAVYQKIVQEHSAAESTTDTRSQRG